MVVMSRNICGRIGVHSFFDPSYFVDSAERYANNSRIKN